MRGVCVCMCAHAHEQARAHMWELTGVCPLTMWVSETKCRLGSKYFHPLSYLAGSLTNFSNKAFFLSLSLLSSFYLGHLQTVKSVTLFRTSSSHIVHLAFPHPCSCLYAMLLLPWAQYLDLFTSLFPREWAQALGFKHNLYTTKQNLCSFKISIWVLWTKHVQNGILT